MAPPVESFPVSQLEQRVQITADGRRRKGQAIKLKNCELLEMAQYKCKLEQDSKVNVKDAMIICKEFARLFRRCDSGLMIETTALEGDGRRYGRT